MSVSPPSPMGQKRAIEDMSSKKAAGKFTSAAAFVESGVQEVYEDSCSICLETFTEEEPCTKTTCNHDYHLQCILEWAQRSTECPMCWQALSLKDPDSQELLVACSQERAFAQSVSPPSFLRSPLEELEFQHRYSASFPDEADLERRIMQHLAAAAAGMSRARFMTGGNRQTSRESSPQGGSSPLSSSVPAASPVARRFLTPATPETGTLIVGGDSSGSSTYSARPASSQSALSNALRNSRSTPPVSNAAMAAGVSPEPLSQNAGTLAPTTPTTPRGVGAAGGGSGQLSSSPGRPGSAPSSGRLAGRAWGSEGGSGKLSARGGTSLSRTASTGSRDDSPQRGGESGSGQSGGSGDMAASLGDAFKSRWVAASSRYRETLSKGTRSFREKLRLRSGAVADLSAKAREVGAGVVRAFERISDPGASSSERPGQDIEKHPDASVAQPSLTTPTPPGPLSSLECTDSTSSEADSGQPASTSDTAPAVLTESAQEEVRGAQAEGNESGVPAGSVSITNRTGSEREEEGAEISLKGGAEAHSGGESHQTAPLAA